MRLTEALPLCEAGVVPSTPRVTDHVAEPLPLTVELTTLINSSSIRIVKGAEFGNPAADTT